MQLKITGWIHFEKFRGMYAGDQCRGRSRSPRRSPPSSDQVEPSVTVADPMTTTTPTAPAARPSSVHTGPGTTTIPTEETGWASITKTDAHRNRTFDKRQALLTTQGQAGADPEKDRRN